MSKNICSYTMHFYQLQGGGVKSKMITLDFFPFPVSI